MSNHEFPRRMFLRGIAAGIAAPFLSQVSATEGPPVTDPRATDGDDRHEPNWDERLTLTVGRQAGDMMGADDKVLQAAVDYVARLGGGTVQVLPGTYTLRNSIWLKSGVRILGSGPESVLTKIPSTSIGLTDDSNWFDQEITLQDAQGFRIGDGVALRCKNPHHSGSTVIKRTLVARSGNRFKLNDGLRENVWLSGTPTCTSVFPLLTSEYTSDVLIENIALDGNRQNNEHFDGNYGGCIFLQDCSRYKIRNVIARNNNGDGISFQICHDVVVENCHSHDHADLGIHPGSGSQRPLIRHNHMQNNGIGLFWCWGVKYGLAENNRIEGSRNYGMSIGHCDTDNVIRDNDIRGSGKVGILFRDENRGRDFWANRNLVENNRIFDSGDESGVAIDIQGKTKDARILRNEIRETRQPMKRVGIRIAADVQRVELVENRIEGFATEVLDQRKPA